MDHNQLYSSSLKDQRAHYMRAFVCYDSLTDQIRRYRRDKDKPVVTHEGVLGEHTTMSWADAIFNFVRNPPNDLAR